MTRTDREVCLDCSLASPRDCMKIGFCRHRDHPAAEVLYELAERVEQQTASNRDLDAEIAERAYGWKPCPVAADCDGENAGEVLTPDGKPIGNGFTYPPRGKIPRSYHCPQYTRNCSDWDLPPNLIRLKTAEALRGLARSLR